MQILSSLLYAISFGHKHRRAHWTKSLKHQLHKNSAFCYSDTNHTNSCKIDTAVSSGAQLPYMQLVLNAASSERFVLLLVLKENKPSKTDSVCEARSCNHCFSGKAVSVTYSVCIQP